MRAWKKAIFKTGQNRTQQHRTKQHKTFQVFICADWQIAQNRTEHDKTAHYRAEHNKTLQAFLRDLYYPEYSVCQETLKQNTTHQNNTNLSDMLVMSNKAGYDNIVYLKI